MMSQSALLLILMSLATCCGIAQGEHSSEVKAVLLLNNSLPVKCTHTAGGRMPACMNHAQQKLLILRRTLGTNTYLSL